MTERLDIFLTHDEPKDGWCTYRLMVGDQEVSHITHRPELPYMAFQALIREIVEPYPDD